MSRTSSVLIPTGVWHHKCTGRCGCCKVRGEGFRAWVDLERDQEGRVQRIRKTDCGVWEVAKEWVKSRSGEREKEEQAEERERASKQARTK